ncbi:hypothetical protein hrd7_25330 [Leptolinea sp. HRD-7]|nr:hypothetical protein hrd7_25330 [Leptolinea sp. HRD-7]
MKNRPIRCFQGTAEPYTRFWTVKNAADTPSGEPEIEFFGVISEYSWWGDEITPQMFRDDLNAIGKGGPVTIKVNSGGGDVVAASVIRSILGEYPGFKTIKVIGMAASAAVAIVLAGDKILIQDTAYMMIHDPLFEVMYATLDIETLESWLACLKTTKTGLADTYANRTGISVDRINRMMTDTTYLSANEAVKMGFADEVLHIGKEAMQESEAVAKANAALLKNYMNVPEALLNQASEPVQSAAVVDLPEDEQRFRDEINFYL